MDRYRVTMDIETADPLLPIDRLVGIMRASILRSLEALTDLERRGRVMTGGYPVGERFVVPVVEARRWQGFGEFCQSAQ